MNRNNQKNKNKMKVLERHSESLDFNLNEMLWHELKQAVQLLFHTGPGRFKELFL